MSICRITSDYTITCDSRKGVGGVQEIIYLANKEDITDIIRNITTRVVEDITVSTTNQFFMFESIPFKNSAKAAFVDGDNQFYSQEMILTLPGVTQPVLNQLGNLIGSELVAIVQTRTLNTASNPENRIFLYGAYNGLRMTASDIVMGPGKEILTGTTLTLSGDEIEPMIEIVPISPTYTSIADFLAVMTTPAP